MARSNNTDRNGGLFSEQTKKDVWNKAQIIPNVDSAKKRKDICGAWIEWGQYGITSENGTGWEIDHIKPVARHGGDEINNLQPLQWQNNRKKGDDYPSNNYCQVSAK
jgi:5-methylcytosine-specific restriction endonuclease McrA